MQLHDHARAGDLEGVRRELAAGVAVDLRDPRTDSTALAEAAACPAASAALLQLLIDHGADVNAVCGLRRGKSILLRAVTSWDVARLEVLLNAGADIHDRSEGGYDVLTSCFFQEGAQRDPRLLETLSFLIERGATLGVSSEYGESALSIASNRGCWDALERLLDAGDDPAPLGWSELHRHVVLGSLAQVEAAASKRADLATRDSWDRTPWLLSLAVGDVAKIEALARAGSDRGARGRCGKLPSFYAIEAGHLHVLEWLIREDFDVDETDDFETSALMQAASAGRAAMVERLLLAGADPKQKNSSDSCAMQEASTVEVMRQLQAAGADIVDICDELRHAFTGLESQALACSPEVFHAGRDRRFGRQNPERIDLPFWRAMICARAQAWTARQLFVPDQPAQTPVWCYARYGQSLTELEDGRIVEIGGEHEDHYDPDFCIYNDVVVHDAKGGFEIYAYPRDLFPPTDFHSATLFESWIYLIGSLGYSGNREFGRAQVYRLCTRDFHIERVETKGDDPGWISRHRAKLLAPSQVHVSEGNLCTKEDYAPNESEFLFELRTHSWSRVAPPRPDSRGVPPRV